MNLIAAVDSNWAIGNNGNLLAHIPADMKYFRELTLDKLVVMGRKTFESLPDKQPLKNRTNIILTSDITSSIEGAYVVHSIKELLMKLESFNSWHVFIIGGESIYKELLPYCDTAYITYIDYAFPETDTYMIDLDGAKPWHLVFESSEKMYYNDLPYTFRRYERIE